jgi:hypothetical protein
LGLGLALALDEAELSEVSSSAEEGVAAFFPPFLEGDVGLA